jgi:hypothetical protein
MIKRSAKAVISENYAKMARGAANGSFMEYHPASRTITGLKRWSSINKDLPGKAFLPLVSPRRHLIDVLPFQGPSQVRAIHVYDFDNTCKARFLSRGLRKSPG